MVYDIYVTKLSLEHVISSTMDTLYRTYCKAPEILCVCEDCARVDPMTVPLNSEVQQASLGQFSLAPRTGGREACRALGVVTQRACTMRGHAKRSTAYALL
jgi:hypothetical protein